MTAIAGIQFPDRAEIAPGQSPLCSMLQALAHRGPETIIESVPGFGEFGVGICSKTAAAVAAAHSPERGIWVVMDGEICLFPNQAAALRSSSDADLVLRLYEEKGASFLDQIDGSYAIAIWDGRECKLILARDRVGYRPLFYARTPDGFVFASEMKAVLASGRCGRELDLPALNRFLSYGYVTNPDTLLASVRQVRPGCVLTLRDRTITERPYWEFAYRPHTSLTPAECHERFRELLTRAVDRRWRRHPDCGAFLSGGLDTSAVVAVLHQLAGRPFKVFTGAFAEPEYDESPDARILADHLSLEHHVVPIEVDRDFSDLLTRIVRYHDAPFADTSAIPSYFTAEYARRHVDTVLTGDFPDQLLGGSGHHAKALAAQSEDKTLRRILCRSPVRRLIARLPLKAGGTSVADRIQRLLYREAYPLDEQRIILDMPIPELLKRCLYSPELMAVNRRHDPLEPARALYNRVGDKGLIDRLLYFDVRVYAPDDLMVKVERMTMAHGLNALSPFCDRELIEFAATLPPEQKIDGLHRKVVLREAVRPLLPAATLAKKKKGFDMPIARWLTQRYPGFVRDVLFDRRTQERGFFRPVFLKKMVNRFLAGETDYASGSEGAIISLLTLELFCRQYVDGESFQT